MSVICLLYPKEYKNFWFSKDDFVEESSLLNQKFLYSFEHSERKKKRRQKKMWKDNIKERQKWSLPAQLGQLKTGQGTIAESFLVPKVMVYNRKYEGHPINHATDIVLDIGYLIANNAIFISQMHSLSFPVNNF